MLRENLSTEQNIMATVKMAISSRDSTSILYSAQTVAGKFCHTLTFFDRISDETLDTLVGLCAGRGALLCIQRKQSAKLITRLSATQTPTPILDDATWAAQVGGSIVGEIEGKHILIPDRQVFLREQGMGLFRSRRGCSPFGPGSKDISKTSTHPDLPSLSVLIRWVCRSPQPPHSVGRTKFWSQISLPPSSR